MMLNKYDQYAGFDAADADVGSWCDTQFVNVATLRGKCKQNGFPYSISPPWTAVGALARGIPRGEAPPPTYSQPTTQASGQGIFGIPSMILLGGGAVLALGVGAMWLTRKKPAMQGLGRYRGRRRRARRSRR